MQPPPDVLDSIAVHESARLGFPISEMREQLASAHTFLVEDYATDSPGYVGPVVLVLWPVSPGAVSTFVRDRTTRLWKHCNSSAW